jgi:leucyl aminopeptidase
MITTHISSKQLSQETAQGYVVLCEQPFVFSDSRAAELKSLYAPLEELIKERSFTAAQNSTLTIAAAKDGKPVYIILAGMGNAKKSAHDKLENYRRAIGQVMRIAEGLKITNLAFSLPKPEIIDTTLFDLAKETITTSYLATYHFDQYITDESRRMTRNYTVTYCIPGVWHDEFKAGIEAGQRIGFAVNQSRHWCDLPPVNLTPTELGKHATRIAKVHKLKARYFSEDDIKAMGMGGIEAVAKGSEQEACMVVLEYEAPKKNAPTIAIVGKGITFDSGGLSIKPASGMETMKDDMAGAAAVISSMEMISHLKPNVNVIGIAPITENLISGHATKPGDIITFYNGLTAEIKNTDAEGRLILADALSYAIKHYKLDGIISIATLTGSCAYALGPFFAGLMSQHPELAEKLLKAGRNSGDRLWELPFHDDYKKAIVSDVADLCNIGNEKYRAGAITAGFFLKAFVGDVPYVHLDVAGTSFNVPDISYYRPGATGFGVRLFAELLMNWK